MQILLDTHIFIWWLKNDRQLSKKARSLITECDTAYVSSVSIWEAAIKIKLGKLQVELSNLVTAIQSEGFVELPFTVTHAATIMDLEDYHRDPFDRSLIAQSISEPLRLVTSDKALIQYSELVDLV